MIAHRARFAEIEFGTGGGLGFAGGEDVVVVVDERARLAGDQQFRLFAIAAWNVEVRMPADAHGERFGAGVLGGDGEATDGGRFTDLKPITYHHFGYFGWRRFTGTSQNLRKNFCRSCGQQWQ